MFIDRIKLFIVGLIYAIPVLVIFFMLFGIADMTRSSVSPSTRGDNNYRSYGSNYRSFQSGWLWQQVYFLHVLIVMGKHSILRLSLLTLAGSAGW